MEIKRHRQRQQENARKRWGRRSDLSGLPWLNPKLELTIMATQKAAKRARNGRSRHFRSCRMTPVAASSPPPPPAPAAPAEKWRPMMAPRGPRIAPSPSSAQHIQLGCSGLEQCCLLPPRVNGESDARAAAAAGFLFTGTEKVISELKAYSTVYATWPRKTATLLFT
jgi:hypothetical protein